MSETIQEAEERTKAKRAKEPASEKGVRKDPRVCVREREGENWDRNIPIEIRIYVYQK